MPAEKKIRTVSLGPLAISDETFHDIADTVGYSIGYWASKAKWDDNARKVKITENAEGDHEVHTVSYDKIHETFWKIVADPDIKLNDRIRGYFIKSVLDGAENGQGDIDAGHIDGDAADALIQLAIFDEIVFG